MATIWKGALTFGLVHIPVELRTAVRSDHVSFRLLHKKDMSPVKYERISSKTGQTVPWSEIVKGFEYEKGRYVVLTDDDFRSASLESSKTIDILDFVPEDEIDPRYFETPYYMVPQKGGEKAYALLREAVRNAGAVGVGKIVMRQKQHLAGVKVAGDALVLEMMRFASEIVDDDAFTFPSADLVRPQELQMAEQLVANLEEPFDPEKYTDDYRANLMKVIKAKLEGEEIEVPESGEFEGDAKVVDLMARLKASLEQQEGGKSGAARKGTSKGAAKTSSRARSTKAATKKPAKGAAKGTTKRAAKSTKSRAKKSA